MLLILAIVLFAASVIVLLIHKNKLAIYISALCISLLVFFLGIMLFIAKKGGYSQEILNFLFLSNAIKIKIQYMYINLNTMGYIIALGRHAFPIFLLIISIFYSKFLKNKMLENIIVIIPQLIILVAYYPLIYRNYIMNNTGLRNALSALSYWLTLLYVLIAISLLVFALCSIKQGYLKRQFAQIAIFLIALGLLFIMYCGQDPGQVYRFYSEGHGLGYLQFKINVFSFWLIVILNLICAILGFSGFVRYTGDAVLRQNEEMGFEQKFNITRSSVSVFVHGIKNQLLSNRVLFKRINQEFSKETANMDTIKAYINDLNENNEMLMLRTKELYLSVRSRSLKLNPISLEALVECAILQFKRKYPEGKAKNILSKDIKILADDSYMCEALANLIINAWEAQVLANNTESDIIIQDYEYQNSVLIEIKDKGIGIAKNKIKKIFEPFYSDKNSNFNWGMGLWSARTVIKKHGGTLRVESKEGEGTSFFISLPLY